MKSKSTVTTRPAQAERALGTKKKTKSLRPMRSMVAVRSLKPKTVATFITKTEAELN